ncbi:hypothetical protein ITI46_02625 [Streptomyces oryzae]|uniref:Lipoprotein n=1 Tax=Streptomyces oryzae TaxID=1434886 RepID=A0ABS3X5I6_9ACTN|nr:hypothetical protein [Streptomyces oryzae]MBO8190608.1 hypothetical protein [Streptomyces oryzae]
MHGGERTTRGERQALAVLVALLLALCGAVHLTGGAAASGTTTVSASAPAADAGPSHCHKSKDGGGALPAAPAAGQQQLLPLALPACLTPQSHSVIGAAHARPPVRGPAPIPPPTPVELSVLRV